MWLPDYKQGIFIGELPINEHNIVAIAIDTEIA